MLRFKMAVKKKNNKTKNEFAFRENSHVTKKTRKILEHTFMSSSETIIPFNHSLKHTIVKRFSEANKQVSTYIPSKNAPAITQIHLKR